MALSFESISVLALKELVDGSEPFVLVDVLPPEHFMLVHIPGAANACVYEIIFAEHMDRITTNHAASIVVYGGGEGSLDAVCAAEKLRRMGFNDISIFHGGIPEWHEAGYALAGDLGTPQPAENVFSCAFDRAWNINPVESTLMWWGRNANTTHHGTVGISSGVLHVNNGAFGGTVTLNMASIQNIDLQGTELHPVLEHHLKSDDFFFTQLFPSAILKMEKAVPMQPQSPTMPTFMISGDLGLRGLHGAVQFPATVTVLDDEHITLEAHFDIDRTDWGVLYGSTRFFKHLSYHLVFDHISIQVRLVAELA